MAKYTQQSHRISVQTPLGDDKLYLRSFRGVEEMSRLFRFSLDLYSDDNWIDPTSIVGKNITVTLKYPDGKERFFNGIVNAFAYQGTGDRVSHYSAQMVPTLWLLTRTADCRIFQDKQIPDILKEVLGQFGVSDHKLSLTGSYPTREYCVQYRETAFNFVSRLMEQYGIFYFFQHENGKHTMVLGDNAGAYEDCIEKEVTFRRNVAGHFDMISAWEHRFEFRPGKWAHTDYNFETPTTNLKADTQSVVPLPGIDKFEMFDFPGEYLTKDEGDALVRVRMEEDEAPYDVVRGGSYCRSFTPGGKFKIKEHISEAETGKSYVLTSVSHSATAGDYVTGGGPVDVTYENSFQCVPDAAVARPARSTPVPVVQGSQTAVVVGPPGEEIFPDKYGRVKVQFFWDRYGKKDDKSSCWIRCMQTAAGRNWGAMSIPRVGQEVVVSYLEGDPDRPVVTGLVYNAQQTPHYTLPDEKTKTYLKTNSSDGGSGHNELRFEDKAGSEQVYLHAEHDMDCRVKNDSREAIGGNRHQIIGTEEKRTDQRELVYKDKHLTVKGNQVEAIGGDMQLKIGDGGSGGNLDVVVGKKETRSIGLDGMHLTVKGDSKEKIDMSLSQEVGMNRDEKVGMNYALDAGMAAHIKGGMTVVVEAGLQLTLKVGGNFIDINPAGVFIQGAMVMINSGGAAGAGAGASPQAPDAPKEAAPIEPDQADDSKSGQKSCD